MLFRNKEVKYERRQLKDLMSALVELKSGVGIAVVFFFFNKSRNAV